MRSFQPSHARLTPRFVRLATVFALVTLLLVAVFAQPMSGMNRNGKTREDGGGTWPYGVCGPDVHIQFEDNAQHTWGTAEKDRIAAAICGWESVPDRYGNDIIDVIRAQDPNQINIRVVGTIDPDGALIGFGNCNDRVLLFKTSYFNTAPNEEIDGLAVHEFGHILGLSHVSGDDDGVDVDFLGGSLPSLTSGACISTADLPSFQSLTQDDRAALTQRQGTGTNPGLQADPSFETTGSTNYFHTQNAASSRVSGSGAPVGNVYLSFTGTEPFPGGNDPYVYQEEVVGYPGSVDAATQIRKVSGSGTVDLRLLKRDIDQSGPYFGGSDAGCTLLWGGSWIIAKSKSGISPTTTFKQYSTNSVNISGIWALRVSVVSGLYYSDPHGDYRAETRIDDAKVRDL